MISIGYLISVLQYDFNKLAGLAVRIAVYVELEGKPRPMTLGTSEFRKARVSGLAKNL